MGKRINMIGVQCNNWEVISEGPKPTELKNKSSVWWNCKCLKCGRIKSFNGSEIRLNRIGECHCDYQYARQKSDKKFLKVDNSNSNKIIDETNNTYGKLTVKSFAYTKDNKAYWNCQCDCGNETIVCGNHLRTGRIKSCGCVVSFKEQEIEQLLKQHNISFQREYSFNDLVDKGRLRFDFAIFQNNKLYGLIEYQGRQHSEPAHSFNQNGLLQQHDKMKAEYCQKHNIPLLLLDKNSNLEQDILNWIQQQA